MDHGVALFRQGKQRPCLLYQARSRRQSPADKSVDLLSVLRTIQKREIMADELYIVYFIPHTINPSHRVTRILGRKPGIALGYNCNSLGDSGRIKHNFLRAGVRPIHIRRRARDRPLDANETAPKLSSHCWKPFTTDILAFSGRAVYIFNDVNNFARES